MNEKSAFDKILETLPAIEENSAKEAVLLLKLCFPSIQQAINQWKKDWQVSCKSLADFPQETILDSVQEFINRPEIDTWIQQYFNSLPEPDENGENFS